MPTGPSRFQVASFWGQELDVFRGKITDVKATTVTTGTLNYTTLNPPISGSGVFTLQGSVAVPVTADVDFYCSPAQWYNDVVVPPTAPLQDSSIGLANMFFWVAPCDGTISEMQACAQGDMNGDEFTATVQVNGVDAGTLSLTWGPNVPSPHIASSVGTVSFLKGDRVQIKMTWNAGRDDDNVIAFSMLVTPA
jgi:hypothetical protein